MQFNRVFAVLTTAVMSFGFAVCVYATPNGNHPTKYYWEDEIGPPGTYDGYFMSCDGFDVNIHLEYSGWWMYHPATPGKGGWEFYHSAWVTMLYNADNPDVYVEGKHGGRLNRHWAGEPFASSNMETGVQMLITLPGHGVVYRDVGRIIWDEYWNPVVYVGQWDGLDGMQEEDYYALCEALAE